VPLTKGTGVEKVKVTSAKSVPRVETSILSLLVPVITPGLPAPLSAKISAQILPVGEAIFFNFAFA